MKKERYKSLQDFVNNYDLSTIDEKSLLIFDIDGVFFKGLFDPREIIGIINMENINAFEKVLSSMAACWIFTNRLSIFKYFPFIKQISKSIKKVTGITPPIYSNCSDFLEARSQKYSIILNAKKPSAESQKVVEEGTSNFKRVIYVSARDNPFYYTDQQLVTKLGKKLNLAKLSFIEIDH